MRYGELATGLRPAGRPTPRYKDVCKRDLRAGDIAPIGLEALAADRNVWMLTTKSAAVKIEQKLKEQHKMKRQRRRVRAASDTLDDTAFLCSTCKKNCRSRNGLYSHSCRCSSTTECRPRRKPIVFRDRRMPTTPVKLTTSLHSALCMRTCAHYVDSKIPNRLISAYHCYGGSGGIILQSGIQLLLRIVANWL